eukprot:2187174-Lingulodinium_polyedra.AAC.1
MKAELGNDVKIPDLWRMSALLEICPKDRKEQMLMRLDEIGEDYEALKNKVTSYATNKVEQSKGVGPVEMEVDNVNEFGYEQEGGGELWEEAVDAVWPATQCYECGGYGHMARGCPNKIHTPAQAKGKGKAGGGKGCIKGKGKDGGKAGGGKGP